MQIFRYMYIRTSSVKSLTESDNFWNITELCLFQLAPLFPYPDFNLQTSSTGVAWIYLLKSFHLLGQRFINYRYDVILVVLLVPSQVVCRSGTNNIVIQCCIRRIESLIKQCKATDTQNSHWSQRFYVPEHCPGAITRLQPWVFGIRSFLQVSHKVGNVLSSDSVALSNIVNKPKALGIPQNLSPQPL